MKNLVISKSRIRNFLSEKLAKNVLKADEEDLILVLRYNALGGFEFLTDEDLFENFTASIPEMNFVELAGADDSHLHLAVKPEHRDEEDAILVDIKRALQII